MKGLPLQNIEYIAYVQDFQEWLTTLGYSQSSVTCLPIHLREFFYYLEQKGISQVWSSPVKVDDGKRADLSFRFWSFNKRAVILTVYIIRYAGITRKRSQP